MYLIISAYLSVSYTSTSFNYAYVDAAGIMDPTPATYTLTWGNPLPVTLARFNTVAEGQTTLLTWTTTSEANSQSFEIQHSTNGKEWANIGSVDSKGESATSVNYSFVNKNPANGENLYRLKMIDRDGSYAYSRINSLNFSIAFRISVYPNPATTMISFTMEGISGWDDIHRVKLYDLNGKIVYISEKPVSGEVDVTHIPAGAYVVSVTHKNGTIRNAKLIIAK